MKNPAYDAGRPFTSELFVAAVNKYVKCAARFLPFLIPSMRVRMVVFEGLPLPMCCVC